MSLVSACIVYETQAKENGKNPEVDNGGGVDSKTISLCRRYILPGWRLVGLDWLQP